MKKHLLLLLLFALTHLCYGQADKLQGDTLNPKQKILFILTRDGKASIATENLIIDAKDIDSLYEIPLNRSVEVRKAMKVNSILVVVPHLFTSLLTLNDIFIQYKVKEENQHLPVRIDNWVRENPESIIIEKSELLEVKIITYKEKPYFINIITRQPLVLDKRMK